MITHGSSGNPPLPPKTIEEPARQTPLYGEYEVAVLGGGPAGIAAAVAAARAGRRTLLIERYGFLGGMGTAAGVTNFCGLHANVFGEMHRVVQGIASELLARIDRLDGLNAPHLIFGKILAQAYDTAAYKIAADDLLSAHKVDILFHALGAGVIMHDDKRINALMVETKAGRQAVVADIFIDCSGDGDLAAWAGARYEDGPAINGLEPDDLTRGEIEGRRQVVNAFEFLRTVPGFEKSYIVDLPPQLGIRETRRVGGGYTLSGEDVLGCSPFDDSIGVNGWPMEVHVAGDVIFKFPPIPESRGFNELPYRMLVPERIDNLLGDGRCASMTHDGQAGARVSGACFAMGEAAGTAAALALGGNMIPRDIAVEKLQQRLKQQGAFLGQDQTIPAGI